MEAIKEKLENEVKQKGEKMTNQDTRICPHCAGEIKAAAHICKHCKKQMPQAVAAAPAEAPAPVPQQSAPAQQLQSTNAV